MEGEGKWRYRFEKVSALKPGQIALFALEAFRLTQVVVGESKVAFFGVECGPLTPLAVAIGRGRAERLIATYDRNDVEFSREEVLVADPDSVEGVPVHSVYTAVVSPGCLCLWSETVAERAAVIRGECATLRLARHRSLTSDRLAEIANVIENNLFSLLDAAGLTDDTDDDDGKQ